jgi:8-oxo-dGTP pyrophosphatase MutT (NUDIX family)
MTRDFVIPVSRASAQRFEEWERDPGQAAAAKLAATVVLVRDGVDGVEVFLQWRVASMAFAPRRAVFPGGSVDPGDRESIPWAGPSAATWAAALGCPPGDAAAIVTAAIRELFEETGVLLASPARQCPDQASQDQTSPEQVSPDQTSQDQTSPEQTSPEQVSPEQVSPEQASPEQTSPEQTSPEKTGAEQTSVDGAGAHVTSEPWRGRARAALLAREATLAGVLRQAGLVARTDLLGYHAHWITPEIEPRRYDTHFFTAVLPEGERADGETSEADRAEWIRPERALATMAEALMPPTIAALEDLATARRAADLVRLRRDVTVILPVPHRVGDGWAMRVATW